MTNQYLAPSQHRIGVQFDPPTKVFELRCLDCNEREALAKGSKLADVLLAAIAHRLGIAVSTTGPLERFGW